MFTFSFVVYLVCNFSCYAMCVTLKANVPSIICTKTKSQLVSVLFAKNFFPYQRADSVVFSPKTSICVLMLRNSNKLDFFSACSLIGHKQQRKAKGFYFSVY